MKAIVVAVALLFGSVVQAQVHEMVFTGRIVETNQTTSLTKVVPEQTTNADGTVTTSYTVYSAPTGEKLASFSTLKSAQEYAATVSPAVAYRSP